MKEIWLEIKYSDVKYFRGGSKTPLRLRKHQNITYTIRTTEERYKIGFSKEYLIYLLERNGKYMCGKNCKIKVNKIH